MKSQSTYRKTLLLGLFAGFVPQPALPIPGCPKTDIPFKIAPDIRVIDLKNLSFSSWDSLQATFLLENKSNQEII